MTVGHPISRDVRHHRAGYYIETKPVQVTGPETVGYCTGIGHELLDFYAITHGHPSGLGQQIHAKQNLSVLVAVGC